MPEMTSVTTVKALFTRNLTLKLLCLALATSVWCLSSTDRRPLVELSLPLKVTDIPPGYSLVTAPPTMITFSLSGPSTLIGSTLRSNKDVTLSMAGAAKTGTTVFMHLETLLKLPDGVAVTRISPAVLELNLELKTSSGGQHP